MNRPRALRLVGGFAAGALLLGACGGDDDTAGDGESPADATSPADDDTAAADDDGDTAASGEAAQFAELASEGFEANARVTYEMTGSTGDIETMTFSSDGERTALLMPEGRMIVTAEGGVIFCDESSSEARCFSMEGQSGAQGMMGAFATPFLGLATTFQEGVNDLPGYASSGEQEIAGRTATCATFDASQFVPAGEGGGEATFCVDAETGIALKYEASTADGTFGMEATEVGEPQAGDFEPPAEPQPMGQGG